MANGSAARAGDPLALHLIALLKVVDLVLTLLHALAPGSLALAVGHGAGHVLPVPTPQVPPVELLESVRVGVEEAADGAVRPLLPILAVVRRARAPSAAAAFLPPAAAVDVGAVLAPIAAELVGALPSPLGVVRGLAALGVVVALLPDLAEGAGARRHGRVGEAEGLGGLRRRRGLLGSGGGLGRGRCRLVGVVTEEAEVVVAGGGHGWPRVAALGLRRGLPSRPRRRR